MKPEIIVCQIKDSKTSRNRFIFYPNKTYLSPYNTTINNLNYKIIKQRRDKEKKNHNKSTILDKKTQNLGTYNFNYDSIENSEIMENKFSKKYQNIFNNNKFNSEKENKIMESSHNEDCTNNEILIKEKKPEIEIVINVNNLSSKENKGIESNNNIKKQENNLLKNKNDFFPKGDGGAKAPNKKIGKKK